MIAGFAARSFAPKLESLPGSCPCSSHQATHARRRLSARTERPGPVSQQSLKGEMGWHFGGSMDFSVAAGL